jgi:hypothetical protein
MSSTPPVTPAPHQRLQAWNACHELATAVYRVTLRWQRDADDQVLADFAREAARQAALGLMLGANGPRREFPTHLDEAIGKLTRLSAILELARDVGVLTQDEFTTLEIQRDHTERLTRGLWRSLVRRNGTKRRGRA